MCNSKLFGKYGSITFTIIRSHTSHPQVKLGEKNSRHWLLSVASITSCQKQSLFVGGQSFDCKFWI